jgi:hypothetical protein
MLLILVAVLAVAYALSPVYLRKALVYQQPGIEDYKIFDNRVVAAENKEPWAVNPGFDQKEIPEQYA